MRKSPTNDIEKFRVTTGPLASSRKSGANGLFFIPRNDVLLRVICSDGTGWDTGRLPGEPWEHVSVSTPNRCPTWEEMDFIKRIFWRDDETVMQLHVARSQHINIHQFCLHLWKPTKERVPVPPLETV